VISKYFRLFWTEPRFVLRFILLIIIGMVAAWQYQTLKIQDHRLSQIMDKHKFLALMQERKENILAKLRAVPQMIPLPAKSYVLEGASLQQGIYQALINGAVYKQGDALDEFVIGTITMNSAVLLNTETGGEKNLQFAGPVLK